MRKTVVLNQPVNIFVRSIVFEGETWIDYEALRFKDKVVLKNLCRILKEMQREDPAIGLGKPEQLKYGLSGFWSRRIAQSERLIYRYDEDSIHIFPSGGHYDTL